MILLLDVQYYNKLWVAFFIHNSESPINMYVVYHHRTRGRDVEGVHIRGIVNAMQELGHSVNVVSFPGADPVSEANGTTCTKDAKQSSKSRWISLIVTAITSYLPEFVFESFEIAYNLITYFRLKHITHNKHPELIYERYSLFLFATVAIAKHRGIPIILEVNDSALVERVRPLLFRKLARRLEKWIFQQATGLVFISTYFKERAESVYENIAPSIVSPNAVDIKIFDPARFNRDTIRNALNIDKYTVCGFVGSFAKWHGIHWFVAEIAPKLKHHNQLLLLLIGDGNMYSEVKDIVSKQGLESQIIMPGRIEHDKVAEMMAAMDFAILPDSNVYGSPMKLFEFMAMGLGILAPNYPPIKEVLKNDQTGWLFRAGDKQACVNKVLELATTKRDLEKVGKSAHKEIILERQWKNNVKDIFRLLDDKYISRKSYN